MKESTVHQSATAGRGPTRAAAPSPNLTFSPVQGTRMHDYAITDLAVDRSRINKRLFIPKLLFLPAILLALVSQHAYVEDGFWDTTWEVVSYLVLMVAAIGRVWTSAYISGRKTHELVADGHYSF